MSRATRLANAIERAMTGPMWHGPALADALKDVTAAQASARPIANAHTIWEIVLHAAAWAEIAQARIKGGRIADPSTEEDWPVMATSEDAWPRALARLAASHQLLAADVRELTDDAFKEKVKGLDYTVSVLLHGVIEHSTYHGGQIMMLRKALG